MPYVSHQNFPICTDHLIEQRAVFHCNGQTKTAFGVGETTRRSNRQSFLLPQPQSSCIVRNDGPKLIKQQVNQLGQEARTQAQGLVSFKPKFSQAVGQVSATIGGSAQRVDQDMIATLQAAEKQVDEAVRALQAAATAAGRYAASL